MVYKIISGKKSQKNSNASGATATLNSSSSKQAITIFQFWATKNGYPSLKVTGAFDADTQAAYAKASSQYDQYLQGVAQRKADSAAANKASQDAEAGKTSMPPSGSTSSPPPNTNAPANTIAPTVSTPTKPGMSKQMKIGLIAGGSLVAIILLVVILKK